MRGIKTMKLFFDTEFTGLHKDTTLISIGIIAENNRCFYATLTDYDVTQVDDWIEKNVINNLEISSELLELYDITEVTGTKQEVKESFLQWLDTLESDSFELVSDVCHYDMTLFVDLFGTAFDLPENISPCCYDINQDIYYSTGSLQEAFDTNREQLLQTLAERTYDDILDKMTPIINLDDSCKHNSLYDAIVIKCLYELIVGGLMEEEEDWF